MNYVGNKMQPLSFRAAKTTKVWQGRPEAFASNHTIPTTKTLLTGRRSSRIAKLTTTRTSCAVKLLATVQDTY